MFERRRRKAGVEEVGQQRTWGSGCRQRLGHSQLHSYFLHELLFSACVSVSKYVRRVVFIFTRVYIFDYEPLCFLFWFVLALLFMQPMVMSKKQVDSYSNTC